jgi:hypothetical protein
VSTSQSCGALSAIKWSFCLSMRRSGTELRRLPSQYADIVALYCEVKRYLYEVKIDTVQSAEAGDVAAFAPSGCLGTDCATY